MDAAWQQILQTGAVGGFAVVFIILFIKKDQQHCDSQAGRISDNQKNIEANQKTIENVTNSLSEAKNVMLRITETTQKLVDTVQSIAQTITLLSRDKNV